MTGYRPRNATKTIVVIATSLIVAAIIAIAWPPPEIAVPTSWTSDVARSRPIPVHTLNPAPNTLTFVERNLSLSIEDSDDVPANPQVLGRLIWSVPITATSGTTILTSHIQTRTQSGILRKVLDLTPGETVITTDPDGQTQTWNATNLDTYLKSQLPRLRSLNGPRTLLIVTCTGTIRKDGHYSHNLVITFKPLQSARPSTELRPES